MLKLRLIVIVLFLLLFCAPQSIYACFCSRGGTPCEDVWKASAVFIGTVVAIDKRQPDLENPHSRDVKISVEESFRGVGSKEITLVTGLSSCDFGFEVGRQYLVYAVKNSTNQRLTTSNCTRTRLLTEAAEDLSYLRNLSLAPSGAKILGQVVRYKRSSDGNGSTVLPVKDVRINVEGVEYKEELLSDEQGEFVVKGLKPGTYKVTIVLAKGLTAGENEHSVTIVDKGCATVSFIVQPDGRLTGQVRNTLGHPVSKAEISIFSADMDPKKVYMTPVLSNDRGMYELKRIQPGKYKLLIRFDGLTSDTRPFPKLYYPGVADPADATAIEIGEGEEIRNYDLIVPEIPHDRTIEGVVFTTGGVIIPDAKVHFRFNSSYQPVSSDSAGRFSLKVYEGVSVALQAYIERNGKRLQSAWVSIPANGDPGKIDLVIEGK